ncbi:hypothetical protein As57867_005679, partial [Aphanomyces stellatus]
MDRPGIPAAGADEDDAAASSVASDHSYDDNNDDDGPMSQPEPPENLIKTVAFKLPTPVNQKAQTRVRQKRTRAQVQKILGWYPPDKVTSMVEAEQAAIDAVKRARAEQRANERLELERIQRRPKRAAHTTIDDNNDDRRTP